MEEAYGLGYATAAVYTEAKERFREREAWHMPLQQCIRRHARTIGAQTAHSQTHTHTPLAQLPKRLSTVYSANIPDTRIYIGMQSF
jgi:hypothetical protein